MSNKYFSVVILLASWGFLSGCGNGISFGPVENAELVSSDVQDFDSKESDLEQVDGEIDFRKCQPDEEQRQTRISAENPRKLYPEEKMDWAKTRSTWIQYFVDENSYDADDSLSWIKISGYGVMEYGVPGGTLAGSRGGLLFYQNGNRLDNNCVVLFPGVSEVKRLNSTRVEVEYIVDYFGSGGPNFATTTKVVLEAIDDQMIPVGGDITAFNERIDLGDYVFL